MMKSREEQKWKMVADLSRERMIVSILTYPKLEIITKVAPKIGIQEDLVKDLAEVFERFDTDSDKFFKCCISILVEEDLWKIVEILLSKRVNDRKMPNRRSGDEVNILRGFLFTEKDEEFDAGEAEMVLLNFFPYSSYEAQCAHLRAKRKSCNDCEAERSCYFHREEGLETLSKEELFSAIRSTENHAAQAFGVRQRKLHERGSFIEPSPCPDSSKGNPIMLRNY